MPQLLVDKSFTVTLNSHHSAHFAKIETHCKNTMSTIKSLQYCWWTAERSKHKAGGQQAGGQQAGGQQAGGQQAGGQQAGGQQAGGQQAGGQQADGQQSSGQQWPNWKNNQQGWHLRGK